MPTAWKRKMKKNTWYEVVNTTSCWSPFFLRQRAIILIVSTINSCERSELLINAASAKILPASDSEHRPRRGGVRQAYRDPSGKR